MDALPKLRRDLTVSEQRTADGVVWVVKDPISGKFFRFREVERFIAEQLDGATQFDVVRQRTEAQFAGSLSPEILDAFIQRLAKAGLLERDEAPDRRHKRRGRIRGSLLYLRIALFDPNPLFDRLSHRVRFFFTPHFLIISAALMVVALGTMIGQWAGLSRELGGLYRVSAIPLLVAVLFVIASAHEFAHGMTCKHFGGEVHEMGFLLIYFQPTLYTNVSDAWLFPQRRHRLWVGLAGPWFELFAWALATVTWRLTDPETGLHAVALMVMAVSGVKTLLNFNPLIKLDGYYLLSDYLDLPNLRQRSFAYVGDRFKRLLGWTVRVAPDITPRERRIYVGYGLMATVCSVGLLAYVVVTTGGFLIDQHQPAALALLAGAVGVQSRRRFDKLFGTGAEPAPPAVAEQPKRSEKAVRARRRRVLWASLAGTTLALVAFGRMDLRIGGAFAVLPEENADVRAQVEGIIEEITVTEGDRVQAGQVIARLANHSLVAEFEKTAPAIRETRAFLSKLEAGPTTEEVAVVKAAVARVEGRLRFAQNNAGRLQSLFETAAVTRQELDAAQELATTAENDLAEAQRRLDLLLRRSRSEDIEASRARLALLDTQRRFLEGEVHELTVVSPVSGVVATPARQLKEMERQLVTRGALIAKVYDFATVMAQIVVSEKDIADINVGQPVALRVRAHPNEVFRGSVTAVAPAADGIPAAGAQGSAASGASGASAVPGRTFTVTTRIDNRSLLLKPGMTGWAKVSCGSRRIADLMMRRVARTMSVEFWSWW